MKHLLNNLSEEEKNSIREQHTGGMKVFNENFNNLVESKLGNVKPLISEQSNDKYYKILKEKIKKTFGISDFCSVSNKTFPYNEDVKKLQQYYIKTNQKSYTSDGNTGEDIKDDGILGERTLYLLCPR